MTSSKNLKKNTMFSVDFTFQKISENIKFSKVFRFSKKKKKWNKLRFCVLLAKPYFLKIDPVHEQLWSFKCIRLKSYL